MYLIKNIQLTILAVVLSSACMGCAESRSIVNIPTDPIYQTHIIDTNLAWSERLAQSIMKRAPIAWKNDFQQDRKWTYTIGLLMNGMLRVGLEKEDQQYIDYAKGYADSLISEEGLIYGYNKADFNIDHIAPGAYLLSLYNQSSEEKYQLAIDHLVEQLKWQPCTSEGGYWHKLRYPWQMWLDGLFMGEPFQARFAKEYNKPELFDKIVHQFTLAEKYTRDPKTGLLYHGWDESRIQAWSNPESGCSPHFWGRAIGWYCMGIVDVLDYFPEDHEGRIVLVDILNRTLSAVLKVRDPESNTWWQVLDKPHEKGNYLESTASCMFTYAMIKGVNNGYLKEAYRQTAEECYDGILNTFVKVDESGEVHLTNCCAVAGLGGDPYRDGSYDYYISEPVINNDAKGLGPFLYASLEFEKVP